MITLLIQPHFLICDVLQGRYFRLFLRGMGKFVKVLFTTFIISTIIGIAANSIYYSIVLKNQIQDYQHAVYRIAGGTFFLNLVLAIMSLPILFLALPGMQQNKVFQYILYFCGPVVLIVFIAFMPLSQANKLFDLRAALAFLLVHTFYYFRTVKKLA